MKASETLKSWIRQHEGFTPVALEDDYAGTPNIVEYAIGYGHQIQTGEDYLYTATITKADAEKLMLKDLAVWETFINTNVKKDLSQDQFDALVNLCYAVGGGNAWPVINLINSGASIDKIKSTWLGIGVYWKGVKNANLVAIRQREVKMYEAGMSNVVMVIIAASLFLTGLVWLGKKLL